MYMTEELIKMLTTNEVKTLRQMYESQVTAPDGTEYVPLSQADLSRLVEVSKITMNTYFKAFEKYNLVQKYGNIRGKYLLTDRAVQVVKAMKSIEKAFEE